MIVDLHVHLADLIVIAMFAAAGVCLVVWAVACFLSWAGARVTDWLHTRIDPPWWWKPWLSRHVEDDYDDDLALAEQEDSLLADLPPERTWEQMTSHQLPVTGSDRHADDLMDGGGLWHGPYAPMLERRAPWWESFHRAQYAALDLEYPSGLMARVRELTP